MVEALEVMAASVEALPGGDIGSMAGSAEIMPGGNYETLDLYTSGSESMYCTWCWSHREQEMKLINDWTKKEQKLSENLTVTHTKNTFILKEIVPVKPYGEVINIYSHHKYGPGRTDLLNFKPKI